MGKIDLAEHERSKMFVDGWRKFGERLGWKLYLIDVKANKPTTAHFERLKPLADAPQKVSFDEHDRADVEASWREQDKPKLEVANG